MIIKQIVYIISFIYWILSYSYLVITPAFLLGKKNIVDLVKLLSQSFSTLVFSNGFKTDFYLAKTDRDIQFEMSQNPELVDILICNHVSTVDFLLVMSWLKHFNISGFNFILKNQIVYTPGFGLIMYASSDIKLNRDWEKDKETLGKQINKIKTEPNGEKQIIIIFPEGTRLTKSKLEEGQKFSLDNGLPVFNNLLVPKTKGLWFLVNHLEQTKRLGKIWDLTLAIPKFIGKSAYVSDIVGKPIGPVYGIVRNIELPQNEYQDLDKFKNWFLQMWKIKDEFIRSYKNFIYQKIEWNNNYKHFGLIIFVGLITGLLLTNKYGRYYLLASFVLSYLLILFKL